jgi:two-component system response regulator GlrR
LPPLRERREDIPLLVQHFLAKYGNEFSNEAPSMMDATIQMLVQYDWPGNVRELEHVIERAVVLSEHGFISEENMDLPGIAGGATEQSFQMAKASVIEQFEKTYIQRLLATYHGNITHSAQAAHKNRRAFWQLIRKHRIAVQDFKPVCTAGRTL